jgi:hypothetical protein
MTSLSVTSHPVAMLLSVMSNGTFCTTTIGKKKRVKDTGNTFNLSPKWARTLPSLIFYSWVIYRVSLPNPNIKVVYRDSSRHSSGEQRVAGQYACVTGSVVTVPWKIYQGRQGSCPLFAKLKVLPGSLTDFLPRWDNTPEAHSRVSNINFDIWKKVVDDGFY